MDYKTLVIIGVVAAIAVAVTAGVYFYVNEAKVKKHMAELDEYLHSDEFKAKALEFMAKAEDIIKGFALGPERLSYVCGALNALLPDWLQEFVTAEKLEEFVNALFEEFSVKENGHNVIKELDIEQVTVIE